MIVYHAMPTGTERKLTQSYAYTSPGGSIRLPAMMPQLQVHLDGWTTYRFPDGREERCRGAVVVGAASSHVDMHMEAGTSLVGVGLLAEGWRSVIGIPADLATDRVLPASSIWNATIMAGLSSVATDVTPLKALASLQAFVCARCSAEPRASTHIAMVDRWLERTGRPAVDDLLRESGLSLRHVERLVRRSHGISPRLLELKYRTLRVAHAMAVAGNSEECAASFYDQSHLIQNFKRFIGATPSRFHQEERFLARRLLVERWNAGARSRLALWG